MLTGESGVRTALLALGEILEAQGLHYAIIVVGGSAMNLHGFVSRTTRDVDVMAFGEPSDGPAPEATRPPDPQRNCPWLSRGSEGKIHRGLLRKLLNE